MPQCFEFRFCASTGIVDWCRTPHSKPSSSRIHLADATCNERSASYDDDDNSNKSTAASACSLVSVTLPTKVPVAPVCLSASETRVSDASGTFT